LSQRIEAFEQQTETTPRRLLMQQECVQKARDRLAEARQQVPERRAILADLEESYRVCQREERPTSRLAQARKRLKAAEHRCQSRESALQSAERRLAKTRVQKDEQLNELKRLIERLACFERDNETNLAPIEAEFRLDAGFGTYENVALLIEMGYKVYTKAHNHQVVTFLQGKTDSETLWTRVGANAEMTVWKDLSLKRCPYPLNVGLTFLHRTETQAQCPAALWQ
jgi:DNA repair exonuclease SbcCD ATPase subunit